jgi:hypothetical protein
MEKKEAPTIPTRTSSIGGTAARLQTQRKISSSLQKSYDELAEQIKSIDDDDNAQTKLEYEQAMLGLQLAKMQKEALRTEQILLQEEKELGNIPDRAFTKQQRDVFRRYISAGNDQWHYTKKKARLEDPGPVQLISGEGIGIGESLLLLYKKADGFDKTRKRPNNWRRDAIEYYSAAGSDHGRSPGIVWCHATRRWCPSRDVTAAHIVPFFLDLSTLAEILFGTKSDTLEKPGNTLMLSNILKRWFDQYHLIVVPVNPQEPTIRRWKVDIISNDIANATVYVTGNGTGITVKDIEGQELMFLNEKRPTARFLYFHFIMAMVRIKDMDRLGWQKIWAKYYDNRPFATPGPYMRRTMLLALVTHFQVTDPNVVESFLEGQGFEAPMNLTTEEVEEAARRVHAAVEESVRHAEEIERENTEEEDSDEEDPDEEDPDEEDLYRSKGLW